jgi:hypothetical protein
MKKQITVANLVMGVGALVVVIFSFLDFFEASGSSSFSSNAWGGDFGLAPATFVPVVLALAMLVFVVLDLLGVKMPARVLTFDWKQIYVFLGISTAGLMLAWLFTDPFGSDKGAGLILMLIGSLAMAAGSIMALLGKGNNTVNIPQGSSSNGGNASGASSASTAGRGTPPPPPPGAGSPPPPPPPPRP